MATTTIDRQLQTHQVQRALRQTVLHVVVIVGAIIFAVPFIWMVRTSVMPADQVWLYPPQWIPNRIILENFNIEGIPFARWFLNSAIVATLSIFRAAGASSLVAFGFARVRFPGKDVLFAVLLATLMLPGQVTLIPTYLLFNRLGWLDTYLPLLLRASLADPFHVFMLRQFFRTIPRELDEAARIDGCNLFALYWRIVLPQALPALGVLAIFEFTFMWNNFYLPLIYLESYTKFPIALGLRMLQGQYRTDMGAMMAATLMAMAPLLVMFYVLQRHFVQAIVITGVKG
jgi:ABC-type glycerol-3-phosphate transport system permease component